MTLTLCAALMQTVMLAAPADNNETYADARRQTTETGKPMVVMVSTDWCGPCQVMKRNVLPKLRERGLFKKVTFAQVNADKDSELAKELTGGGPVPQLVMYRRTERGWLRRRLVGGQSVEAVEKFIKEELASDETENKADKTFYDDDFDLWEYFFLEMPDKLPKSSDSQSG
jgi:thiol-disulfide isomerase/thioredoxin